MNIREMRDLAGAVAAELSRLRGETWTVDGVDPEEHEHPVAYLAGPASARLRLVDSWDVTGKVTVEGLFPDGGCTFTANIDPARGAAVVAREAGRRVLDSGYLGDLPGLLDRKRNQDERAARRLALLNQAAALFGLTVADDDRRLYLGDFVRGEGRVACYSPVGDALNINLSGIPAETALAMLRVLAEAAGPGTGGE